VAELAQRFLVLGLGAIELAAVQQHGLDAARLRAVRIVDGLALGVVLAVDRHPLLGHHAGGEPEPEAEEVRGNRVQVERAVRLRPVQEDRHRGDRDVRRDQGVREDLPAVERREAVREPIDERSEHRIQHIHVASLGDKSGKTLDSIRRVRGYPWKSTDITARSRRLDADQAARRSQAAAKKPSLPCRWVHRRRSGRSPATGVGDLGALQQLERRQPANEPPRSPASNAAATSSSSSSSGLQVAIDQPPARLQQPRRRVEDGALLLAQGGEGLGRLPPLQVGLRRSVPSPVQGASTSTRSILPARRLIRSSRSCAICTG
jgi:hypothetical protein